MTNMFMETEQTKAAFLQIEQDYPKHLANMLTGYFSVDNYEHEIINAASMYDFKQIAAMAIAISIYRANHDT